MKFQLIVWGLFNFLHTILRTSKSIGNNTIEKNATRATLTCNRMCSTDVYCSKQTGSGSTKETITHHFFVSGIGQKKTVDAAKICGGAEMLLKQKSKRHS